MSEVKIQEMKIQEDNFSNDFDNFFKSRTITKAPKAFKITKTKLVSMYPDVFYKKNKMIYISSGQEDKAKEIMKEYYIPNIVKSGVRIYEYKSGAYTSHSYYKPKESKFKDIADNYKDILNNKSLTPKQKTEQIFYDQKYNYPLDYEQLYGYIYRTF